MEIKVTTTLNKNQIDSVIHSLTKLVEGHVPSNDVLLATYDNVSGFLNELRQYEVEDPDEREKDHDRESWLKL